MGQGGIMKKLLLVLLVIAAVLVECAVWTSWVQAADKQDLIEAFKQLPIEEQRRIVDALEEIEETKKALRKADIVQIDSPVGYVIMQLANVFGKPFTERRYVNGRVIVDDYPVSVDNGTPVKAIDLNIPHTHVLVKLLTGGFAGYYGWIDIDYIALY
jgi:hypothetical protein